jgi:hypothetical protein
MATTGGHCRDREPPFCVIPDERQGPPWQAQNWSIRSRRRVRWLVLSSGTISFGFARP